MNIKELCIQYALGTISDRDLLLIVETTKDTEILHKLSGHSSDWVRSCIVKNKKCPIKLLRQLSKDKDWFVRYWVLNNPKCPKDIVLKLTNDVDYHSVRPFAQHLIENINIKRMYYE
jgi:hypothetical protein